jgi:metal-responsive CopG/Arc/MetJ family transcriptional regulator
LQDTLMTVESTTISLRLPKALLERLDEAVKATQRSRSFLMRKALDRYLAEIQKIERAVSVGPIT